MPKPVGVGADDHVLMRSLAEQLVSEANAVLANHGEVITLEDELADGRLGFRLAYRDRCARVVTRFTRGRALGRLLGDGVGTSQPCELTSPEEVETLLLLLLTDPDATSSPAG
ncbi:hypothetical protein NGB36_00495 [Streptomyces sp. RB6PN25]|uniref:Uncharacterized protein n=1 Tax=Streptomyces humicola TaxID=2953240 RepID=A0ABT1PRE5_9ACTN|nr:hypothetical protein [Streptomyces humicola]MCQ4079132.1 hypothetical protein [Streptomyces humicola]